MGNGNHPFTAIGGDIPENHPDELTHSTNQLANNQYGEMKNLVESSGQTLTALVADDPQQVSKAAFIYSARANYFTANHSTANAKILNPLNAGIVLPALSLLDGCEFKFINKGTNTGSVTLIVNAAGMTQPLPLLNHDGLPLVAGNIKDGVEYSVRYYSAIASFMVVNTQYTTASEVSAIVEARVGDYVTSTFAANVYTVAMNPVITTAAQRGSFMFKAAAANTGAVSIADGAGTVALTNEVGGALVAGDIAAGAVCSVVWDAARRAYRMTEQVNSQMSATYAPLASPALTGTPTAPTAAAGTNTTQIATTAFVNAEIVADRPFEATTANIKMDGAQSVGVLNTVARGDHVHPTDTSRAPLASPSFTGTPTAPTAAVATNTTQLASTAFVQNELNSRRYVSGELTITNGGQITVSHGLGAMPTHATGWLKCVTAEFGYAVGDMVLHPLSSDPNGGNEALTMTVTSTQLIVRVGESGPYDSTRKDNGYGEVFSAAKWCLILKASL